MSLAEQAGALLAEKRRADGETLKTVAARAKMSPPALSELESGRANPTLERLERIAEAYGFGFAFIVVERGRKAS